MFARMGRLLITLVIGFILLVAIVVVGIPLLLSAFGYWVNPTATEMAEGAVEQNDVNECRRLISYGLFAPPTGEKRRVCIRIFAELTKDPSACELLMPSSYGWSCLGAAEEPNARMCWFDFGQNAQKIGDAVMPECGAREDSVSVRCCQMAKFLYVEKTSNCDEFNDSVPLHDQCLELVARRDRDIDECSLIRSDHVRTACEVAVGALLKQ
ncbi:MAG: hypothetical protein KBC47_04910 [Candidatus Peribacteraceae bacterium]|nr:hypothetical protein [Candidatus Peribacteraceae bacterium]